MMEYKVIETQKYKIMVAVIIGQFVTLLFSFLFIGSVQSEALDLQIDNAELKDKYKQMAVYKSEWDDFNRSYIIQTCLPRVPEIEGLYNGNR